MSIDRSFFRALFEPYWWMKLVAVLAMSVSTACASLPSYDALKENAGAGVPQVAGRRGMLPRAQGEAVLQRLESQADTGLLERHLSFMAALGSGPLVTGNRVRLLMDGPQTYEAMFASIAAARSHINLETYILEEDEVGRKFAGLLIERQRQGVQVNLMYDGVGSFSTSGEFFTKLREAGVRICEFNPVGRFFSVNHRDHRKMLIVDGETAFTGGINISKVYSGSAFGKRRHKEGDPPWRDTHIELQGPAAKEFQKLFIDSWQRQSCAPLTEANYLPDVQRKGDTVVQALGSRADDKVNLIYASLLSAIEHAERSVHITMAYFVPNQQLVDALKKAVARGVDVRLVMPGFSDYWVTFNAGRSYYTELLEGGVKIYERRDALLHAKTAVIDDVWSTVGSSNMDFRSFLHNDEVNAVILGAGFARQMEDMFRNDVDASVEISLDEWKKRGAMKRVKEGFARLWGYWL